MWGVGDVCWCDRMKGIGCAPSLSSGGMSYFVPAMGWNACGSPCVHWCSCLWCQFLFMLVCLGCTAMYLQLVSLRSDVQHWASCIYLGLHTGVRRSC